MRLLFFAPLFLILLNNQLNAENVGPNFIVELKARDVLERTKLAQLIHIDSIFQDRVFAVVNGLDFNALIDNQVEIISAETISDEGAIDAYYAPFVGQVIDFPDEDEAFHTYDEALEDLRTLEKDHASFAHVFSIGKSVEDRDIWAIRISDDTDAAEDPKEAEKPAIVYMGTHHAREHVSTEIPLMFASELLNRIDTDPDIKSLLKRIEIYVIPIVNPDGTTYDIIGKNYKWWRKNRSINPDKTRGVDLNRNYGFGWGTGGSSSNPGSDIYMGHAPFSEPETKAIRDFFVAHDNVTIALSLHTYSELILYPWGGKDTGIGGEDEEIFKRMAADMAAMNHYRPMQSSDLYIASGDTCDWLYGERSVFCFTFELSPSSVFDGGFYPGASIIQQVFDDNLAPMLYLANATENPKVVLR